jgi:hypothetical protein
MKVYRAVLSYPVIFEGELGRTTLQSTDKGIRNMTLTNVGISIEWENGETFIVREWKYVQLTAEAPPTPSKAKK